MTGDACRNCGNETCVYRKNPAECAQVRRTLYGERPNVTRQATDPPYYVGKTGLLARKVVEDFCLNWHIGSAVSYLLRHERKGDPLGDLRKALDFIQIEIERRERAAAESEREK